MKRKYKLKAIAILFILIFTVFTVTAAAEKVQVTNEELGDSYSEPSADESPDAVTDSPSNAEITVFDEIYLALTENADKIFAALAFVGTLLVSFAYKKGLLPLLRNAISSLLGSVDSIKESGSELMRHTDDKLSSLCESMQELREHNALTGDSVIEINKRLDSLDEATRKYDQTKVILASQIDMLYAIFISSALPQYQKEEVSEKIKQMREELKSYGNSEE